MSRNTRFRRGLYRSRNGIILGVCKGIADYFDFSVSWIRAILIILVIFTGFWPVIGFYILAAFLIKSESGRHLGSGSNHWFEDRFEYTKHDIADRLKRKWEYLEKRIRKMEDKITSRKFDWNNRFHR